MKKIFHIRAILFVCILLCLTSCEKHDGISYLKSKCVAELNGQQYIDQTPFAQVLNPDSPEATPYFICSQYDAVFETHLSVDRKSQPVFYVKMNLFADTPEAFLHEAQTIERIEIEYPDGEPNNWDYVRYCEQNKVSYVKVNGELVSKATFQITSFDKEKRTYNGTFTISYSEGTLTGKFWI